MRVAIGADHAGFQLKEDLAKLLADQGYAMLDMGTHSEAPVDYPDYAAAVGRAVREGRADRGVLVCGSGAGAAIAANKLKGVRAALAHDTYTAHQAVEHDDANVIALGSRVIGEAGVLRGQVGRAEDERPRHQRQDQTRRGCEPWGPPHRVTRRRRRGRGRCGGQ